MINKVAKHIKQGTLFYTVIKNTIGKAVRRPDLRNHQLSDVVNALLLFNSDCQGKEKKRYKYLMNGPYLLPVKAMQFRIIIIIVNSILRKQRPPQIVTLPFQCTSIRIKNNLRIFGYGPKRNLSVKIALKSKYRSGNLFREIRTRRIICRKGKASALLPKLYQHDLNSGKWLLEELIVEGKANNQEKAEHFISSYAFYFYNATCKQQPLSKFKQKELFNDVKRYLPNSMFVNNTFSLNSTWPVALCHGDLSPGNMVSNDNGQLYLVDWERAGVRPIAIDVFKIYKCYPELQLKILDILEELSSKTEQSIDARFQIAIASAIQCVKWEKEKAKWCEYFVQVQGISEQEALQHLIDVVKLNKKIIKELTTKNHTTYPCQTS